MDQAFLTKSASKSQQQHQQQQQQQNTSDQLKNLTQSAENLFLVRQKDLTNLAEREKFLQTLQAKQQQVTDQTRQVNSLLAEISSLNDKCRDQVKVAEDEIQQCDSKISTCEYLQGHQQNVALHLGTEKLFSFLDGQKINQNQFFVNHPSNNNNNNNNNENVNDDISSNDNKNAMFLFENLLQILHQGKISCEQDLLQMKNQNNNNHFPFVLVDNNNASTIFDQENAQEPSSIEFYKRQTEELKKMTLQMQNHQMKMFQNKDKNNNNFAFTSFHESSLELFLQQQQNFEINNTNDDQNSTYLSAAFKNLLPPFLFDIFLLQQQKQNENSEINSLENIVEGLTSSQILELISRNNNQKNIFSSSSPFANNTNSDELLQLESTSSRLSQEIKNLDSVLLPKRSQQLDLTKEENNRLKQEFGEKSDLVQILQQQHQEAQNESVVQENKRNEFSLFVQSETNQIQHILSKYNANNSSLLLQDEKEIEEQNEITSTKNRCNNDETSNLISMKLPQLQQLFQKLFQLHDENQQIEREIVHLEQTLVLQQENIEEKTNKLKSLLQRRDYLVGLVQKVSLEIVKNDFFENKIDHVLFDRRDFFAESNEDDVVGFDDENCDEEKKLVDNGMMQLFETTLSNNASPINGEDCALLTGMNNNNNDGNSDEKENKQLLQQIVKKNVKKSLLSAKRSWERVSNELSPLVSEKQQQLDDISHHFETCVS